MVTKPEREPEPETGADRVEHAVRSAIAGHPQGAVRRIVLYFVMIAAMGASYYVPVLVVVALACAALLVSTDSLL